LPDGHKTSDDYGVKNLPEEPYLGTLRKLAASKTCLRSAAVTAALRTADLSCAELEEVARSGSAAAGSQVALDDVEVHSGAARYYRCGEALAE